MRDLRLSGEIPADGSSKVIITMNSSAWRQYCLTNGRRSVWFFCLTATLVGAFGLFVAAVNAKESGGVFFRFTSEETSQLTGSAAKGHAEVPAERSSRLGTTKILIGDESTANSSGVVAIPKSIRQVSAQMTDPVPTDPVPLSDQNSIGVAPKSLLTEEFQVGSETLADAWRIALETSRSLQSKDYEYSQAQMDTRAALGVGLPKLTNASGRHTISESYATETSMMGFTIPTYLNDQDFTTSITSLTIPVYMGGRVRGMLQGANAAASAIAAGKQISTLDLKYEVASSYFLVFRVRRLLEVAQEAEKTIAGHEKDAKRLFENGVVTKNVVLSAEVALANARQDVIKAQNAAALSEAAYNRLLWRPLNTPVDISDEPIPELSGELETLTAEAIGRRPELTALAYKSRALAAEAKVRRADRLPQMAVVGSHNYFENSHLNTDSSFSGHVGMVWMPVDGGVSRARQQAANYESMAVTKQYEDAKTGIELQVYQNWLDETESRGRVEVARKAVVQANENLRVTTRGFQEGLINHTEVLDATAMWTQAQSNFANARYDAILSTYRLRRATGEL